jgi:gliding motility-associated protein GldL
MGKYRGFKNRVERYVSSEHGQRLFNFAYSFGASIVILGALFKLLHLPMADLMLCVGMGTEAFIFGLSAFDKPAKNYHWENVFPSLASDEYVDGEDLVDAMRKMHGIHPSQPASDGTAPQATPLNAAPQQAAAPQQTIDFGQNPDVAAASALYATRMEEMTDQLERLREMTARLTEVSATLLNSYEAVSGNSDTLSACSSGYVKQMEALNRNISGLNTIYEIQLKSVSSQLDTIDKVNSGLTSIRQLYENSTLDSFKIRQETEKMTENLAQLNKVYERMLTAMTVGMQQPRP